MTIRDRRCTRCGNEYTAEEVVSGQAFRSGAGAGRKMHLATTCRPCEETARDLRNGVDRWPGKVNDTTRRHAIRLRFPKSLGPDGQSWHDPDLTTDKLITVHGWQRTQLAYDAQFQYGNGCSYCHHKYSGMGHGAADITLDIFDPRLPPEYGTNTRWCCMTCQRRKGLLTPEKWAIKKRIYRKWEANKLRAPEDKGFLPFSVAG